ncbi:MAG: hypothetical protein J4G15_07115, partial [Alphaproteobacteria bacterium]|nr:hypothetical protein [Alphaproteobacteria bacterium]
MAARPIEAAGPEPDRRQSRIDQNLGASRYGGGEAKFIGGDLAFDDGAIVGYGLAPGQIVLAWPVV